MAFVSLNTRQPDMPHSVGIELTAGGSKTHYQGRRHATQGMLTTHAHLVVLEGLAGGEVEGSLSSAPSILSTLSAG